MKTTWEEGEHEASICVVTAAAVPIDPSVRHGGIVANTDLGFLAALGHSIGARWWMGALALGATMWALVLAV